MSAERSEVRQRGTRRVSTACLLCQAKVAPNYYDHEDCQELIQELAERLKETEKEKWMRYADVS
jgi:hypothetical protein